MFGAIPAAERFAAAGADMLEAQVIMCLHPTLHVWTVQLVVLRFRHDYEVAQIVIGSASINMMHMFPAMQLSAEMFFHDNSVGLLILTIGLTHILVTSAFVSLSAPAQRNPQRFARFENSYLGAAKLLGYLVRGVFLIPAEKPRSILQLIGARRAAAWPRHNAVTMKRDYYTSIATPQLFGNLPCGLGRIGGAKPGGIMQLRDVFWHVPSVT